MRGMTHDRLMTEHKRSLTGDRGFITVCLLDNREIIITFYEGKLKISYFCLLQLSDVISVRLLSGTSAMLSFRCNNESVQLPLSVLSNLNKSRETVR